MRFVDDFFCCSDTRPTLMVTPFLTSVFSSSRIRMPRVEISRLIPWSVRSPIRTSTRVSAR